VMPTLEFGLASAAASALGGPHTHMVPPKYQRVFTDCLKSVAGSRFCPDIVAHLDLDMPRLDVRLAFRLVCHYFQLLTAQVTWNTPDAIDGDDQPTANQPKPPPVCTVRSDQCPSLLHAAWEAELILFRTQTAQHDTHRHDPAHLALRHKYALDWLKIANLRRTDHPPARCRRHHNAPAQTPAAFDSLWILDYPTTLNVDGQIVELDLSLPDDRVKYFAMAIPAVIRNFMTLTGVPQERQYLGPRWRHTVQRALRRLLYDRDYDAQRTILCTSLLGVSDPGNDSPPGLEPYLSIARQLQTDGLHAVPEWTAFRARSWTCSPTLASYCLLKTRRGAEQYLDLPSRDLRRSILTWRSGPGPRRGALTNCPICHDATAFLLLHWLTFRGGCTDTAIRRLNQDLWRTIRRTAMLKPRADPDRVIAGAVKSLQRYRSDANIVHKPAHQLPLQLLLGGYISAEPGWNPAEIDSLVRQSRTPYPVWALSVPGKLAMKRALARWNVLQASAQFLQQLSTILTTVTSIAAPVPDPTDIQPTVTAAQPWRLPFRNANHGLLLDALST